MILVPLDETQSHIKSISAKHGREKCVVEELFTLPLVLVPSHDTRHLGLLLNVLAVAEDRPELTVEGALVLVVQVAKHGLDGLGSILSVVEGNATGNTC